MKTKPKKVINIEQTFQDGLSVDLENGGYVMGVLSKENNDVIRWKFRIGNAVTTFALSQEAVKAMNLIADELKVANQLALAG